MFRRVWRGVVPLLIIISAYVAWAELFVQRFNTKPEGSVTSGLPYPFLNSMEWGERLNFYLFNGAIALVLLVVFGVIGALVYRIWRTQMPA